MPSKNTTVHLNDDLKFLIACCQTEPADEDINFILSYLSLVPGGHGGTAPTDKNLKPDSSKMNALISLANQHGILPLVYKTIKNIVENDSSLVSGGHGGTAPTECSGRTQGYSPYTAILTELKTHYMSIAQRNMLMSAELIKIMHLLSENHIEALAFKGPVLAQMAYGDITLRQYADLDVLIRKEDIYKIDTLLKEKGYQRLFNITPTQEKVYMKYAHDIGLIHPKKGVHFEMHWSLLDEDYPIQVDLKDFWKETQEVKLNGYPIYTFSNENLLIYLCIHGSKHLWERIEWLKDIDLLIRENEINWKEVIEKSKGTGFEKMIYLGLFLSTTLFSTPLTLIVLEEIKKYQQFYIISSFIFESWQTSKSAFQQTRTMLKFFPSIKEQLLYLHKIILKPSFNEYWFVNLPQGFHWAYYLVRPYLLFKKYLFKST